MCLISALIRAYKISQHLKCETVTDKPLKLEAKSLVRMTPKLID